MGTVYRVLDELEGGGVVALKALQGTSLPERALRLFKAEFKAMTSLRHPNVAQVIDFDAFAATTGHFFTMELVPGRDLWTATADVSLDVIIDLVVQTCRALSYIHHRNVVHFDLKPDNIRVMPDGTVKILDFGLVGFRGSSLEQGEVFGSPAFIAPEIWMGGDYDHRVDLYSLGIILYGLVFRELPFRSKKTSMLMLGHCRQPLPLDSVDRSSVPPWLIDVITQLCAKRPDERPRNGNAVIQALAAGSGVAHDLETDETLNSYVLSADFVGRDRELDTLFDAVSDAQRAILVAGPAGSGKSRLIRELRFRLQLDGTAFVSGDCYEGAQDGYGPMAAVVGHLARFAAGMQRDDLVQQFGPELVKVDPSLSALGGIEPSASLDNQASEQVRLLERVTDFFVAVAELTPFVLHVNDLQWARLGAVQLLEHLVRRVELERGAGHTVPISVLLSYRPADIAHRPCADLIQSLAEPALKLELSGLELDSVHDLVASILGQGSVPADFVSRIHAETEGNAFFVQEVMRALIENGSIQRTAGAWTTQADLDIATGVADVFRRRAALLDAPSRRVLEMIAVAGQPIRGSIVERATGLDADAFDQALAELLRRDMIAKVEGPALMVRISHERARGLIYGSIDGERQRGLHQLLAEALAAEPMPDVFALAHHYWHAGRAAEALQFTLQAADVAERIYANDLGVELLGRAIELTQDPADRAPMIERVGDLSVLRGAYDDAIAHYERALAASSTRLDQSRQYRKIGKVHLQRGEYAPAVSFVWKALELVGERRPRGSAGMAIALTGALGKLLVRQRTDATPKPQTDRETSRHVAATYMVMADICFVYDANAWLLSVTRASRAADQIEDSREKSRTYSALCVCYGVLGRREHAAYFGRRAIEMAETIGAPFGAAHARSYAAIAAFFGADWGQAYEHAAAAHAQFLELGDVWELGVTNIHMCFSDFFRGNFRRAVEDVQRGLDAMNRVGAAHVEKYLWGLRGWSRARLGEHEGAIEDVSRELAMSEEAQEPFGVSVALMRLGDCLLTAGQLDEAVETLERARRIREEKKLAHDYLVYIYPLLARAYLEKARGGDAKAAKAGRAVTKRATQLASKHPSYVAPAHICLGIAEGLDGRRSKSTRAFERARSAAESQGASCWLADAHFEQGRLTGDRAAIERAIALYESCGAVPDLERATAALSGE